MDEFENPGASADAHGASGDILTDASDHSANGESLQGDVASRYDLIRYRSLFCMFDGPDSVATYDGVPDRARTDPALGSVEVREAVFLGLASIVESLVGGWPVNIKRRVGYEYSALIARFGAALNVELVECLIRETLSEYVEGGRADG